MAAKFEELTDLIAGHEQHEKLSTSFRREILDNLLLRSESPQEALEKMLQCLAWREKLKDVDDKMDKPYFEKLVKSDYFQFSGTDRTGRPVLWARFGFYEQGIWRYKKGSPKFWAQLRATIFAYEAALSTMAGSRFMGPIMISNDSERKALDFNVAFYKTLFAYVNGLFSAAFCLASPDNPMRVLGTGATVAIINKLLFTAIGLQNLDFICFPDCSYEHINADVADLSLMPVSFVAVCSKGDSQTVVGTEYRHDTPGNNWLCHRLSREGGHIEAAEVFNPPSQCYCAPELDLSEGSIDKEEEGGDDDYFNALSCLPSGTQSNGSGPNWGRESY